jgi:hypothetical protein
LLALVITLAASAQVNLVGYWNPIFDEDWLERIPGPDVDDYAGLPITAAARKRANTSEASLPTPHGRLLGGRTRRHRAGQRFTILPNYRPCFG